MSKKDYSLENSKYIARKISYDNDWKPFIGPLKPFEINLIKDARNILTKQTGLNFSEPTFKKIENRNKVEGVYLDDHTDIAAAYSKAEHVELDIWDLVSHFHTIAYSVKKREWLSERKGLSPQPELGILIKKIIRLQKENFEVYPSNQKILDVLIPYRNYFEGVENLMIKKPRGGKPVSPDIWLLKKLAEFNISKLQKEEYLTHPQLILIMIAYGLWLPKKDNLTLELLIEKVLPAVALTLTKPLTSKENKLYEYPVRRTFTKFANSTTSKKTS